MARWSNPYRPGTLSHARFRKSELNRLRALAEARAARAKQPAKRRRALQQAATARRGLRQIPMLEAIAEYRSRLGENNRRIFDRMPMSEKVKDVEVAREFPDGIPPDVPDPFADNSLAKRSYRSEHWLLNYATRTGFRRRAA